MPKLEDIVSRRRGVEARVLPQGALLVDMNTGRCFKLNRVGAEVWAMIDPPNSLRDICERVSAGYRLSPEAIEHEIRALVEHLLKEGLVEPALGSTSPAFGT